MGNKCSLPPNCSKCDVPGFRVKEILYVENSTTYNPDSSNWNEATATFVATIDQGESIGPYTCDWNVNFNNPEVPFRTFTTFGTEIKLTMNKSDLRTDGYDYSFWMNAVVRDANRSCAKSDNFFLNINRKP